MSAFAHYGLKSDIAACPKNVRLGNDLRVHGLDSKSRRDSGFNAARLNAFPIWGQYLPPRAGSATSIWGLMGTGYPSHSTQERLDGSSPGCDEYTNDEQTGDVVLLREENARLRRLVVTLSDPHPQKYADRR